MSVAETIGRAVLEHFQGGIVFNRDRAESINARAVVRGRGHRWRIALPPKRDVFAAEPEPPRFRPDEEEVEPRYALALVVADLGPDEITVRVGYGPRSRTLVWWYGGRRAASHEAECAPAPQEESEAPE